MRFFGTGTRRIRTGLGSVPIPCAQCRRSATQTFESLHTWVTLLYIGVLPLGYEYFTVCPTCRTVARVDKAEAERLKGLSVQSPS